MRQIPCGFVNPTTRLLIGAGVLVDPKIFFKEVDLMKVEGRIGVDGQCAVIEETHVARELGDEHLSKVVKSTGTGCGPCMEDRVKRVAKLVRDVAELRPYLTDVSSELMRRSTRGKTS